MAIDLTHPSVLLFLAFSMWTCRSLGAREIEIEAASDRSLTIAGHKMKVTIKTEMRINGYEMDCSQKYLLIWGHPEFLNPNNPQDTVVSIVDIAKLQIVGNVAISKGVFSAEFLKDKPLALIAADAEFLIRLPDGQVQPSPDGLDFSGAEYERESCDRSPSSRYRRLSDH